MYSVFLSYTAYLVFQIGISVCFRVIFSLRSACVILLRGLFRAVCFICFLRFGRRASFAIALRFQRGCGAALGKIAVPLPGGTAAKEESCQKHSGYNRCYKNF